MVKLSGRIRLRRVVKCEGVGATMGHSVEIIVRDNCGSCVRVKAQILPIVEAAGIKLTERNVDQDASLKLEFGDRVPVILVDDEEFACWEVDNDELANALL